MATIIYRPGRTQLFNGVIQIGQFANELWAALVTEGSSFMDEHPIVMDDFTDLLEPSSVGYARQNLGGIGVLQEPAKDRVYIPTTFVSSIFSLEAGEIITGAVVYWKITDDTDSIPLWGYELGTPHKVRIAGNYEFPWPEDGLCEIPEFGERAFLTGRKNLLEGWAPYTTGFKLKLVMEGTSIFTDTNPAILSEITNLDEFDGSGYSEQDVTFTVNTDAVRDRVYLASDPTAFGTLGNGTRKIAGGLVYIPAAINSVTNTLVYALRLAQPIDPDGAAYSFPWNQLDGVAYL